MNKFKLQQPSYENAKSKLIQYILSRSRTFGLMALLINSCDKIISTVCLTRPIILCKRLLAQSFLKWVCLFHMSRSLYPENWLRIIAPKQESIDRSTLGHFPDISFTFKVPKPRHTTYSTKIQGINSINEYLMAAQYIIRSIEENLRHNKDSQVIWESVINECKNVPKNIRADGPKSMPDNVATTRFSCNTPVVANDVSFDFLFHSSCQADIEVVNRLFSFRHGSNDSIAQASDERIAEPLFYLMKLIFENQNEKSNSTFSGQSLALLISNTIAEPRLLLTMYNSCNSSTNSQYSVNRTAFKLIVKHVSTSSAVFTKNPSTQNHNIEYIQSSVVENESKCELQSDDPAFDSNEHVIFLLLSELKKDCISPRILRNSLEDLLTQKTSDQLLESLNRSQNSTRSLESLVIDENMANQCLSAISLLSQQHAGYLLVEMVVYCQLVMALLHDQVSVCYNTTTKDWEIQGGDISTVEQKTAFLNRLQILFRRSFTTYVNMKQAPTKQNPLQIYLEVAEDMGRCIPW